MKPSGQLLHPADISCFWDPNNVLRSITKSRIMFQVYLCSFHRDEK